MRNRAPLLPYIAVGSVAGALVGAIGVTVWMLANPPAPSPDVAPPRLRPALRAAPMPTPKPLTPTAVSSDAYPIKRALTVDRQMNHGDWLWNDSGVPPGKVLITVDLAAQMMSVFRDGYEIGVAVIEHGAPDKPTPLGSFPILGKDADHVSSKYLDPRGRPAPMHFMLRLTGDGVAIHAANIRSDWASNGCVGIPDAFARRLFAVAQIGDRVVITSGAVMRVGQVVAAR